MNLSHPAAELLGRPRACVLRSLARVSEGLTGRHIAQLSDVAHATTQRVLADLEGIGLVDSLPAGRSRLYSLNRAHVMWKPIEDMLAAPARLEEEIGEAARNVADVHATVALYGSTARGDADSESDVDLVVVWDDRTDQADRWQLVDALTEHVQRATGNRVELVDLSVKELEAMVARNDPLLDSWLADARTVAGADLKRLIREAAP
ncbi:nucleotidyltransferase domain-containing protein [Rathayibacter soli]|uniref:nucleotidyltransferase domain-containing protein n=1 Tax=Rathayibacter soli TaxID=3144168 RepID=UPI0027E59E20|nr:nucleotidyltransferase domain-containing protein [Glaciibacter superstes]